MTSAPAIHDQMRAVVLHEPGDPSHLVMERVQRPVIGPHEALVRVRAAGVCYHDVVVMKGILRRGVKPDVILGHEIAGEIAELGDQVRGFAPGDRVVTILTDCCGACVRCLAGHEHRCLNGGGFGHDLDGGYAEYVRVGAQALVKLPAGIPFEQAAILGCPVGVAYEGIVQRAKVQPGETVLVTGAGGGLGVHSIEVARLAGARVLAVTTSASKVERLKELGADEVILSPDLDFDKRVLELTGGLGVDVVVDNVGGLVFKPVFKSLSTYGRLLFLGEVSGVEVKLNPALMIFKEPALLGSAGVSRKSLQEVVRLVSWGRLKPVAQLFRLEDAPRVHQMLLDRKLLGRAVLTP